MFYPHDLVPPKPQHPRRPGQVGDHDENMWAYAERQALKPPSREQIFNLLCAGIVASIVATPYIIHFLL